MSPHTTLVSTVLLVITALKIVTTSPLPSTSASASDFSYSLSSSDTDRDLSIRLLQSASNTNNAIQRPPPLNQPTTNLSAPSIHCDSPPSPVINWRFCTKALTGFNADPISIIPARWGNPNAHSPSDEGYLPIIAHAGNCGITYDRLTTTQVGEPWILGKYNWLVFQVIQQCTREKHGVGGTAYLGPNDGRQIMAKVGVYQRGTAEGEEKKKKRNLAPSTLSTKSSSSTSSSPSLDFSYPVPLTEPSDAQLTTSLLSLPSPNTTTNLTDPTITCAGPTTPWIDWRDCRNALSAFAQNPLALTPAPWGDPRARTHFDLGYLPVRAHAGTCLITWDKLTTTHVGAPWALRGYFREIGELIIRCTKRDDEGVGGITFVGPEEGARQIMVSVGKSVVAEVDVQGEGSSTISPPQSSR